MASRVSSLLAACALAAMLAGCGGARSSDAAPGQPPLYKLTIGKAKATVRIAATPDDRSKGLSGRIALGPDEGMLFIFPTATRPAFWMKDTPTPLSIAFITPEGQITEIMDMAPETLELHAPKELSTMALEMHQGWFEKHSVKPGDRVIPAGGMLPVATY